MEESNSWLRKSFKQEKKDSHNTVNILIEIFIMFELKETEMGFLGLKVKQ